MWDIPNSTQLIWINHSDKQLIYYHALTLLVLGDFNTFYQRNMHVHEHDYIQLMSLFNIALNLSLKLWTAKCALQRLKYRFGCTQSMPVCMENDGLTIDRNIFCISERKRGNTLHWFSSPIHPKQNVPGLTLKGQLLPIIDLKIILQIIETKNQYHKWHTHWVVRSVITAAFKNDNT